MHREHPLRILRYSFRHIWLLAFPALHGGTAFGILILLLILAFGWLRWYFRRFSVRSNAVCVQEGVIFRRIRCIPIARLSVLTLEYPFWLLPFRGMYVCADTNAGSTHRHDLRLLIHRKDAAMFRARLPRLRCDMRSRGCTPVHPWRILLFSVIFSSSLSGALYAAAFWFQGGRLTRELIAEFSLIERLDAASQEAAGRLSGIPPAAVTIGILILAARLLSLVNNLLRYGKFTMQRDDRLLFVRSGILTKRSFWLQSDKINFLDIRQNLLTKLSRMSSLAVNCAGYGSQRGTIPVCLPILTQREINRTLPLLFTGAALHPNQLKAPLSAWWSFLWKPVIGLIAVLPAAYVLARLVPQLRGIIGFLRLMLLIPICWKLIVQTAALLTSGASVQDSRICLRYCRGFVFHTIIARTDRIVKVRMTQNPFQRWFGKCSLIFTFCTERGNSCLVRNVPHKEAHELLAKLDVLHHETWHLC